MVSSRLLPLAAFNNNTRKGTQSPIHRTCPASPYAHSLFIMKGSSKDSRSWKPMGLPPSSFVSSVPSPSPAPAAPIKPEPGSNSLRPASPPKVNPWQTASKAPKPKPVPLDLFSEDPPLPGTAWKVDGGQEECKSPPPLSIASTHSASSAQPETSASRTHRSDSTSSNGSQTVLQAAVPRVTEK